MQKDILSAAIPQLDHILQKTLRFKQMQTSQFFNVYPAL